jgi:lipopolysaccharide export system protein LptC
MKNQIEKFISFLFVIVSIMLVIAFAGSAYVFHINDAEERVNHAETTALTKISNCRTTVYDISRVRGKLARNGYYSRDSQP